MNRTPQQQLAEYAGSQRPKVIAVASGKGGVGKTNISANLAICLATTGKRVALFDADFGLANLDIILGVNSKYNLSHFIKGAKPLEQICQPACGGIDVICGLCGLESLANVSEFSRERLLKALETLTSSYDVVLIDTAAGIGKDVLGFCLSCDHTVVVTTPEPTAITDAYTLVKAMKFKSYKGQMSLLVNMAASINEGKKVYRQVASAATQFLDIKLNCAGVLARDEHVPVSVRKRQPVVLAYPRCATSRSLMTIAARLSRVAVSSDAEYGFFKKVVNWLF